MNVSVSGVNDFIGRGNGKRGRERERVRIVKCARRIQGYIVIRINDNKL